jgi:hypothetical protein
VNAVIGTSVGYCTEVCLMRMTTSSNRSVARPLPPQTTTTVGIRRELGRLRFVAGAAPEPQVLHSLKQFRLLGFKLRVAEDSGRVKFGQLLDPSIPSHE